MPRRCLLSVHERSLHAPEVKTAVNAQNLDDTTGLSRFAGPGGCVSRSFRALLSKHLKFLSKSEGPAP